MFETSENRKFKVRKKSVRNRLNKFELLGRAETKFEKNNRENSIKLIEEDKNGKNSRKLRKLNGKRWNYRTIGQFAGSPMAATSAMQPASDRPLRKWQGAPVDFITSQPDSSEDDRTRRTSLAMIYFLQQVADAFSLPGQHEQH